MRIVSISSWIVFFGFVWMFHFFGCGGGGFPQEVFEKEKFQQDASMSKEVFPDLVEQDIRSIEEPFELEQASDKPMCKVGENRVCYTGEFKHQGRGICEEGKQICTGKGVWSKCVGSVLPASSDLCDQKDNDCDGQVDEDFPEKGKPCTVGQGMCENTGKYICKEDGSGVKCAVQPKQPQQELCDGLDNDCDGQVDEDFPEKGNPCTAGKGICRNAGKNVCKRDGSGVKCDAIPHEPRKMEICNNKDDDCNGKIDDGLAKITFYKDADGDTYGDPKNSIESCRPPLGYVIKGGDCYDKNPDVFPGQSSFFSVHRGDGSFDYNCDLKETKRFRQQGSCKKCQSSAIDIGFLSPQSVSCGKSGQWLTHCRFDVGKCQSKTKMKIQECH